MRAARGLAITGATATGKTAVALEVARRLGGEIVSVDSRQAYRGVAVGTAAPPAAERAEIPHHGVGILEPGERYSAGDFARLARAWMEEIEARGRVPIFAGGTGFFLRALLDPVFREPEMDDARRARLRRWLSAQTPGELAAWAGRLDRDATAGSGSRLDPQRAARVLEIALLTGHALSWWRRVAETEARPVALRVAVLELSPGEHRRRIERRTQQLLDGGWLDEVRALVAAGVYEDAPVFSAVGFPQVAALLRGEMSRAAAQESIVRQTWQLARRQRTWFRHQLPDGALRLDARCPPAELAARICDLWEGAGSPVGRRAGRREPEVSGKGGKR